MAYTVSPLYSSLDQPLSPRAVLLAISPLYSTYSIVPFISGRLLNVVYYLAVTVSSTLLKTIPSSASFILSYNLSSGSNGSASLS